MEPLVEFETLGEKGNIGVARLVREKPLNSLLLKTVDLLSEKLGSWLEDDQIHCILLDSSSERAFCAGADITALYRSIVEAAGGENSYADNFFLHEYRLDYVLHTARKPVIAWGNGIVMGGGLGLLGGCSHRIGTPATRIAMPEITIGLFPDAGGTWLLSNLPDRLGSFVGLTGCQLSAADGLGLGLLDLVVDAASKASILGELSGLSFTGDPEGDGALISNLLERFATTEALPEQLLAHKASVRDLIAACESSDDYLTTFDQGLAALPEDDWLQAARETYRSGSPLTAKIVVEQMRRARGMSLADMLRMELAIAYRCVRGPEFPEGVRALLIDKDRNPEWQFRGHGEVPDALVAEHFVPSWRGAHPLAELD